MLIRYRRTLFPLLALMALGLLATGVFYQQNFDQGVEFPNLGNLDESLDCNTIDRDKLLVILAVGQSNASNYGSVPFTPGKNVFSFYNGRCFPGHDPQPGADGIGGSIWSRLADLMVHKGYARNVMIVAVGAGGSSVSEWVPEAKYYPRLVDAAHSLKEANLTPGMIIWLQGSRDAGMAPEVYRNHLRDVIFAFPILGFRLGPAARLFVATHTRCSSAAAPGIQAAQQSMVDHANYIFAGPNMDTLEDDVKHFGCHYNELGLNLAAKMWLGAIERAEAESAWLPRETSNDRQKPLPGTP